MSAFLQRLGSLRSPVATYANLPITGNTLGDLRITTDVGVLYTWTLESGSGSLSGWKKVTVSSYNDLTGRPSSSLLDIDNCVTSIKGIFMNYILIFFMKTITYGIKIQKMFDGLLDNFQSKNTLNAISSNHYKHIITQGVNTLDYFYKPNFDGNLDDYTKILIHGNQWSNEIFFDDVKNQLNPNAVSYDNGIWNTWALKFFDRSFYFLGTSNMFLMFNRVEEDGWPDQVEGLDFTWDLWICPAVVDEQRFIILQPGESLSSNFLIEQTIDNKIRVRAVHSIYNGPTIPPTETETVDITGTTEIEINTWYHVAVVRQNGYYKLFVNGNLETTSLNSDVHNIKQAQLGMWNIGGNGDRQNNFSGWMDEIRYSKGVARWTSSFTPSTVPYNSPLVSTEAEKKLLLHCNTLVDDSLDCKPVTAYGNAQIDTAIKKFGTGSLKLDGDGDYIEVPSSQDFDFFYLKSFTVEGWFYTTDNTKEQYFFSRNASEYTYYGLRYDGNGKIVWEENSWNPDYLHRVIESSITLSNNTWHHIAMVRYWKSEVPGQGATWYLFVDGVSIPFTLNPPPGNIGGDTYSNAIPEMIAPFVIGNYTRDTSKGWKGYIDEFRVSVSSVDFSGAKYIVNFTPASSPFLSYSEQPVVNNMVIQSEGFETNYVPTSARVVVFEEDDVVSNDPLVLDRIEPNQDIKVYVSRDGGITFTQVIITKEINVIAEKYTSFLHATVNFYVGTVDLSTQPNGQLIVFKITTHNNRKLLIRSVAVNWR